MLHNLSLALSHAATDYAISGQLRETWEQQYFTHNSAENIVKRKISGECQTHICTVEQIKEIKKLLFVVCNELLVALY